MDEYGKDFAIYIFTFTFEIHWYKLETPTLPYSQRFLRLNFFFLKSIFAALLHLSVRSGVAKREELSGELRISI